MVFTACAKNSNTYCAAVRKYKPLFLCAPDSSYSWYTSKAYLPKPCLGFFYSRATCRSTFSITITVVPRLRIGWSGTITFCLANFSIASFPSLHLCPVPVIKNWTGEGLGMRLYRGFIPLRRKPGNKASVILSPPYLNSACNH